MSFLQESLALTSAAEFMNGPVSCAFVCVFVSVRVCLCVCFPYTRKIRNDDSREALSASVMRLVQDNISLVIVAMKMYLTY